MKIALVLAVLFVVVGLIAISIMRAGAKFDEAVERDMEKLAESERTANGE